MASPSFSDAKHVAVSSSSTRISRASAPWPTCGTNHSVSRRSADEVVLTQSCQRGRGHDDGVDPVATGGGEAGGHVAAKAHDAKIGSALEQERASPR